MPTFTKTFFLIGAFVLVGVGISAFLYLTRPVAAPSETASTTEAGATAGEKLFALIAEESVATFRIFEELRGEPVTVVGTTSAVAGAVVINPTNPAAATITPITINARTFITDNERRNAAIARLILKAEDPANEFITFTPTALDGFPENPQIGEELYFTVTGDLQIMDMVKPVSFAVIATAESENRITGVAKATLKRSDFGITVPSLPFLANVADVVELELSFVVAGE